MKAARYYGRGDMRVEETPAPCPARDELLLEVLAVGVCGTDAGQFAHGPSIFPIDRPHPYSGHPGGPMVPGHELAGRVAEMGDDVEGFTVGEVVACAGTVWCGTCRWCRAGRTNLCKRAWSVGLHRDGGLAELCAVPARSCAPVPYGLTADAAALAQPMGIAVHAVGRGEPVAGEHALVLGAGGVGTFITWVLTQAGITTTVCDLDPTRLAIAKALGATSVLQAERGTLATVLGQLPAPPDVIYEVTGSEEGLGVALGVVGAGGRLVVVGHQHGSGPPAKWLDLSLREWTVIGTQALVCRTDLPEALRLLAARRESWADLAPTALSLDRLVDEGLAPLAEGHATRIKTLVDPWASAPRATRM